VGFLSGAQMDRHANLNTTVVGDYHKPKVRLPGGGGAPEIASSCQEIFITMAMSRRSFVEHLPFMTSFGHGTGRGSRAALGLATKGPTRVMTDLCVLEPDPESCELVVTSLHPGVTQEAARAACGWPLRFSEPLITTAAPTPQELAVLRDLQARSAAAHREAS
jgi:glutaconate CoA-transferase subunit B